MSTIVQNWIPEIGLSTQSTIESLQYGRLIQDAILCTRNQLQKTVGDFCIIYEPKNILSGDFYYCNNKKNFKYLAVCDCTGHGISGSLLTILCHNMFERSLRKHTELKDIINYLNNNIIDSFDTQSTIKGIGMDFSIIRIDPTKGVINYIGARRPFLLVREDEIIHVKPQRNSVGESKDIEWVEHEIQVQSKDKIFLYTDGFVDQFGAETDAKFSTKYFKKLLLEHVKLPIIELEKILLNAFLEHRKDTINTDDVLVIGIEV